MSLATHIDEARKRLAEVEKELAQFDFSSPTADQKQYEELNREYQRLGKLSELWDRRCKAEADLASNLELLESESDEEFLEVVRADVEELRQAISKSDRDIKTLVLPPAEFEDRHIIVEIRPAAGGDEAGLFAGDLFRMYSRFAENRGWKTEVLSLTENDIGGVKDVSFSVVGDNVFRFLRFESGVHRVQRIPVTESGGRIHTSTVTVAVLPEAEEVDVDIKPEDLRIDVFRSSGPGGQSVNTTDSAVRITHTPTGLSVSSQQEKSQHRNRETAMRILRSRILEMRQAEEAAKNAAERRQQVGTGDRSERIRTYNFPQNRLTDHRFKITRHDLTEILEGSMDDLLSEIVAQDVEMRLQAEVGE
jgi:peptide chain release factor 1